MSTKYVKFLRGTPAAYNNLAAPNEDTLYFISEEGSSTGSLYLGSKLISSHREIQNGATSLADLSDVLLTELANDTHLLVYDPSAAAWVNKTFEDLVFVGTVGSADGAPGLVPAPSKDDADLFLRSDGTWARPAANHTILTLENSDSLDHQVLIQNETENVDNISGDIIIIKDLIANGKYEHTAYVYDNDTWQAMSGNYNAENVYFDEDLVTTAAVGNITLTNGQATIAAAGKNLKQVFETIFVTEKNPTNTKPSVTLTFSNGKAVEVGTKVTPSYTASLSAGSYTYGPATGISATSWTVTDSDGNSKGNSKDSFPEITVGDNTNYSITANATYNAGAIPVTNLGNPYTAAQIAAGNATSTKGGLVGYRNGFYGTLENKNALTSDIIRGLKASGKALAAKEAIVCDIPVGAYRVIFAYPATLNDLTSITDTNGLGAEILSGFTVETIDVEGYDGYEAKPYKVYYIDYAEANETANSYTFTIG